MFYSLLFINILLSGVYCIYHVQTPTNDCNCNCPKVAAAGTTVCQKLSRFEKELSTVKDAIESRTRYIKEIHTLKEKMEWQEYVVQMLTDKVELLSKLTPETMNTLKPESLIMNPKDQMQNDGDSLIVDAGGNSVNMTSLLAKVENVENMTMEVQEELKSERRVRRHIEEDLSEARSSIKVLGDKFLNLSLPLENRVAQVEEIIIANSDAMNKTALEEQLQKLHYKVDGVVYKNETRKLDERLNSLETELLSETNSSLIEKLSEEVKVVAESLNDLNKTIEIKFASNDIRADQLELKARKIDEVETLDQKVEILWNATNNMLGGLDELWNYMHDVKNETTQQLKEMELQLNEIQNNTVNFVKKEIQNCTSEIFYFKEKLFEMHGSVVGIQKEVRMLGADVAIIENKMQDLNFMMDSSLKGINEKLDNVTDNWVRELDSRTKEVLEKKSKMIGEINVDQDLIDLSVSEENTMHKLSVEFGDEDLGIITISKRSDLCTLPISSDSHLMITMKKNDSDGQSLEFFCSPKEQYILREASEEMRCENGEWIGALPSCKRLPTEEEIEVEKLKELIPTIEIDPNKINKTNGLMGISNDGHLVIYPGVSFKLHCLYPDNRFGSPRWNKNSHHYPFLSEGIANKVTVSLVNPNTEDSGVYTCITPFSKQTSITIEVKAIYCPAFKPDTPHGKHVFYRPHPEGMEKVLSTEAQFLCEHGRTLTSVCLADGTWSRNAPTADECPISNHLISEMPWNCSDLDTSSKPGLRLEPRNSGRIVYFKCPGNKKLRGSAFTRCTKDGVWSHTRLPDCESLT